MDREDSGLPLRQFDVSASVHASVEIFGAGRLVIGPRSRVDAHVIITCDEDVIIGRNVHVGAGTHIFGGHGVTISDFASISSRVSIFTSTDDYSGGAMTNPTVPMGLRNTLDRPIFIGEHAIIGCGSVLVPGARLDFGAAVGALSFVNKRVPTGAVVTGNPLRRIGSRDTDRLREAAANMKGSYE